MNKVQILDRIVDIRGACFTAYRNWSCLECPLNTACARMFIDAETSPAERCHHRLATAKQMLFEDVLLRYEKPSST